MTTRTRTVPGARTVTGDLEHEVFCLPRPGSDEPRIESYQADRPGPDGIEIAARVTVTRCQECGAATYEG